jgi:hypothetical protein
MAYGDGFVNNLLYVFYCDPPVQKKQKQKEKRKKKST